MRKPLDLLLPANDWNAIGVILVERGIELLRENGGWHIVGTLAPLLKHHLALGLDVLFRKHQIAHPVGLETHHVRQFGRCDLLVIGREVIGGESVLAAAHRCNCRRELARWIGARALEHQVLKEMGDARFSRLLIGAAHLVPEHVRGNRRPVIRDNDNVKAVF